MMTSLTIDQIVQEWLSETDAKEGTKNDYEKKISQWFRFLATIKADKRNPQKEHIIKYKNHLIEDKKSDYTINGYLRAVTLFYSWCKKKEYIGTNISDGVKRLHVDPYYHKKILSIEQAKNLLESIPKERTKDLRDRTIISLMLLNGLRTCEVENINIGDISKIDGLPVIWIKRKGRASKNEFVRVHEEIITLINEYMGQTGRTTEAKDAPLFISVMTIRDKSQRLSNRHLRKVVKERFNKIGLTDYSAHCLRHSFACILIQMKYGIDQVRELMGHSSIQNTMIYAKLAERHEALHNSPAIGLANELLK